MKNNLIFMGLLFLGISMIVSALILSKSESKQLHTITGSLNQSVNLTQLDSLHNNTSDIILPHDAAIILGYESQEKLVKDIRDGELQEIPYVLIDNQVRFSKRALEEWIYDKSLSK